MSSLNQLHDNMTSTTAQEDGPAGRVLGFCPTKGASGTPMILRLAALGGKAPAAMINIELDGLAALGCIVNGIPVIADLERGPFEATATGDDVLVGRSGSGPGETMGWLRLAFGCSILHSCMIGSVPGRCDCGPLACRADPRASTQ